MKKVTLLGDSIRLGYESRVTELLKPDFEVFTYKDNGRFAAYTLRSLFDYREQIAGSDVIHWNNGHWDLCDLFGDGIFHLDRSVHRLSPAHRRPAKPTPPNIQQKAAGRTSGFFIPGYVPASQNHSP